MPPSGRSNRLSTDMGEVQFSIRSERQLMEQMQYNLLPFGPDREQDLDQRRTQQPFGCDRGSAFARVELIEIGVERDQRRIHDLADRAQRMARRDAIFEAHVTKQRAVLGI